MTVVNEFDAVRIQQPAEASVFGVPGMREMVIPAGTRGVVVHVHGPRDNPSGYEVEFRLERLRGYAIASVYAEHVTKP
jgi:hypothetical protein